MREFEYEELCKATKNFSISQIIGKGSHGCIYKGLLEDEHVVAIKRTSVGLQELRDDSKLENEACILSSLPKTDNVVSLLGTGCDSIRSTRQKKVSGSSSSVQMLVMEFIPNGSLHDLLHSFNTHFSILLTWEKRAQIALQVAKAMQFLHTLKPKVIHRDIKSTNILLDKNMSPKLIDFGFAVRLDDQVDSVLPAGTIGYLDPWYTTPCKLSTKNDVYSFGVLLLEIITGQKVIDTTRSSTSLVEWALPLINNRNFDRIFDRNMALPRFMEGVIRQLVDVAVRCVSSNADDRPTSDEIVSEIENGYYCYVERVRFPNWYKFVRGFIVLKRRASYSRKITCKKKCANNVTILKCVACQRDVFQRTNNEKLLRDFLDDAIDE